MKTREETAKFLTDQLNYTIEIERTKPRGRYSWQDARDLLDFIYGGKPTNKTELLINSDPSKALRIGIKS